MEKLNKIKKYAEFHIKNLTEEIEDYLDEFNSRQYEDFINELITDREYWKDILKIINNNDNDLYINFPF